MQGWTGGQDCISLCQISIISKESRPYFVERNFVCGCSDKFSVCGVLNLFGGLALLLRTKATPTSFSLFGLLKCCVFAALVLARRAQRCNGPCFQLCNSVCASSLPRNRFLSSAEAGPLFLLFFFFPCSRGAPSLFSFALRTLFSPVALD